MMLTTMMTVIVVQQQQILRHDRNPPPLTISLTFSAPLTHPEPLLSSFILSPHPQNTGTSRRRTHLSK